MGMPNSLSSSVEDSTVEPSVDTDGNGDVEVTLGGLRHIESPADVNASASGGYTASVQSVDGNTVTVRVFQSAGADAEHSAVTGGNDVTDLQVRAVGV